MLNINAKQKSILKRFQNNFKLEKCRQIYQLKHTAHFINKIEENRTVQKGQVRVDNT